MFSVPILFPGLKCVFEKLCFHEGLVWTVGQTVKTKAAFSHFYAIVWMLPWYKLKNLTQMFTLKCFQNE